MARDSVARWRMVRLGAHRAGVGAVRGARHVRPLAAGRQVVVRHRGVRPRRGVVRVRRRVRHHRGVVRVHRRVRHQRGVVRVHRRHRGVVCVVRPVHVLRLAGRANGRQRVVVVVLRSLGGLGLGRLLAALRRSDRRIDRRIDRCPTPSAAPSDVHRLSLPYYPPGVENRRRPLTCQSWAAGPRPSRRRPPARWA